MALFGYARVSTKDQRLEAQIKALIEYGVPEENIFKEKVSGRKKDGREEFKKLLETVTAGDTVVVTKLDRFARSTRDALNTIEYLKEKGVDLVILDMGGDKVDTNTPLGKLLLTFLAGIAEFEVELIRERQMEGIKLAKSRGVYKGRPKKYNQYHEGLQFALALMENRDKNNLTVEKISKITQISRATLYRAYKEYRKQASETASEGFKKAR